MNLTIKQYKNCRLILPSIAANNSLGVHAVSDNITELYIIAILYGSSIAKFFKSLIIFKLI